jgi:hypothetical protein
MSLIGTSDIRSWLSIPDGEKAPNDKLLTLCSAVQAFAESYTNRKLEAQQFRTNPDYCYFDGSGRSYMYLPVYPIWSITEVALDNSGDLTYADPITISDIFFDPTGKVYTKGAYFSRGRRNIRFDYYAGYGAGSYPLPADLKQVMVEMVVDSYKSGLTAIHQVQLPTGETSFMKLLSANSFWKEVLGKYKRIGCMETDYDDA